MACPSSEALNWQWTPQWCPLFVEMDPRTVELRSVTASLWWRPGEERTYPELNGLRAPMALCLPHTRWRVITGTLV